MFLLFHFFGDKTLEIFETKEYISRMHRCLVRGSQYFWFFSVISIIKIDHLYNIFWILKHFGIDHHWRHYMPKYASKGVKLIPFNATITADCIECVDKCNIFG